MPEFARWKHRIVRDLAWVIVSPTLVSGHFSGVDWWDSAFLTSEYRDCLPALAQLDINPEPLAKYLALLKTKALGHRFEALVAFWLELSPNYDLIDRNIQIQGEGRTLGELDFIVRDLRSDAVIHLEVTVKFYMGLKDLTDPMNWYGSNLKDSFGKKLEHLEQHQSQLSLLYPERINYKIEQRCCLVKGRLFYPENTSIDESKYTTSVESFGDASRTTDIGSFESKGEGKQPKWVTSNHLHGVWGNDVEAYSKQQSVDEVFPIQKSEWLSEFLVTDQSQFHSDLLKDSALKNDLTVTGNTLVVKDPTRPHCYVLRKNGQEWGRYFQFPKAYFDSVL